MRRIIATVAVGEHEELLQLALHRIQNFANKYDYEISVCRKKLDTRPTTWTKILHILKLMEDFDEILWIDSDTVILSDVSDIAEEIHADTDLAWVWHTYDNQTHPNSGVMYIKVNERSRQLFITANQQEDLTNHPWSDQAALMRVLGIDSTVWPIGPGDIIEILELGLQKLPNKWNSIRQDSAFQQARYRTWQPVQLPDCGESFRHDVSRYDRRRLLRILLFRGAAFIM